jgi:hypothetical protein
MTNARVPRSSLLFEALVRSPGPTKPTAGFDATTHNRQYVAGELGGRAEVMPGKRAAWFWVLVRAAERWERAILRRTESGNRS